MAVRVKRLAQQIAPSEHVRRVEEEAESWGIPDVTDPRPGEIPVLDMARCLAADPGAVQELSDCIRSACASTGFFLLQNHGCEEHIESVLAENVRFHSALSEAEKDSIAFADGVGYLRLNTRLLPRRAKGNLNESLVLKREHGPRNVTLSKSGPDGNRWPEEARLPGFRERVVQYAAAMEGLARRLLPAFALALDLPANFFDPAFREPLVRLRLSHYPAREAAAPGGEAAGAGEGQFGIAPHVDTSFFTLLATDGVSDGLVVSTTDGRWVKVPSVPGAIVVNTGELLKQWSNDRMPSTKHFANNVNSSTAAAGAASASRHSVPFFFNATADYRMECLPSCTGPGNPPRYAPMSFLEGQGVAQAE
jgi:isopenicillin N synthase-like dioxygenase